MARWRREEEREQQGGRGMSMSISGSSSSSTATSGSTTSSTTSSSSDVEAPHTLGASFNGMGSTAAVQIDALGSAEAGFETRERVSSVFSASLARMGSHQELGS